MPVPTPNTSTLRMRLASSPEFVTRVQFQVWTVAENVFAESTGTTQHTARLVLAQAAITSLPAAAAKFNQALVNNVNVINTIYQDDYGDIRTNVIDDDLFAAVTSLWTAVALGTA